MARDVGILVRMAQHENWDVCVVTTPDGRKFVDAPALQRQTGHPVRTYYKSPGDADALPPADAMIVAPATVNTVNKWACGITDTLVLGLLVEGYGFGIPTVVVPYTNKVMALHPALHDSLAKLRDWGVHVVHGEFGGPGQTDRFRSARGGSRRYEAIGLALHATLYVGLLLLVMSPEERAKKVK